ncbi:selenoneine biosynthesis selenosugar synthase SenB [Zwartia sp.]|uniref:selenoneine biosynthesis selenosugar synthase SenB n=1 Tax=Zwartia sp. TaxID=2978004 RepID=UPI003BB0585C
MPILPTPTRLNVVIVSPALAAANNGNWQTAQRYASMLRSCCRVRIVQRWDGSDQDHVMIALHARRSYASIADWHVRHGARGLVVVLTGTDLYRDIQSDPEAQQSLRWAHTLVVLQTEGVQAVPEAFQPKTVVAFQSTTTRQTLPKTTRHLRALMVGHLRAEKSPQTFFKAAKLLAEQTDIHLQHVGGEHDPELAREAHETAAACPRYAFLGARPHEATRRLIQRAHVLVHPSVMEGGAHVVMESICSGVPVIASRISGNEGMLGQEYAGFFPTGDANALAALLLRVRHEPSFYALLASQCALRAPLFAPALEQERLITIVQQSISS